MTECDQGDAQLVIRPMRLEDIPQVHAIDTTSFTLPWSERSFRYEVSENQNARAWVAEIIQKNATSQVVAMLVMWIIVDEVHIATIAVHPDHRRKKLAQRLLATALLALPADQVKVAYLEVRKGNLAAQNLYRRFGFEEVGVRPHYYQDNQEDALLMTLFSLQPVQLKRLAEAK